jgi:DNA-binding NtrC family response regulator
VLTILFIEDEHLFAKSVSKRLLRDGHHCVIASSIGEGQRQLDQQIPDIVMLDVRLPDGSGLDFLASLRQSHRTELQTLPVIIITAYGELDDAVHAMKLGANDYIKKPVDLDELSLILTKVIKQKDLSVSLSMSRERDAQVHPDTPLIGESQVIDEFRIQLNKISDMMKRTTGHVPVVLVTGETGTGKDVVAQHYHQLTKDQHAPYVHVDCTSLPAELIEAELFGYEKGAFTHAHQSKAGLIEAAEHGTVFLDEIGELPLDLQSKLLNVLERRVARRLGSTREYSVNAHIIAATNRNLQEMVSQGLFRSDLYFRLNILELTLPPLRERHDDAIMLSEHFIKLISKRYGLTPAKLTSNARSSIRAYSWPGNVRELQHVIERAVMLHKGDEIGQQDLLLQPHFSTSAVTSDVTELLVGMTIEEVEKMMIAASLKRTAGNVSQSARELGLTRMAIRYRMDKYNL